ncbi:helix-turn-helix domain-containing protein [Nocardia sp. NBC_01503]|uniref:PucR family transcriptional regulator n=1 Tax=Nocardia sp. NBC_01503 TaxID=2975997 RepID=UPI002E7B8B00|nr:helix-turn-helix domain-containing protein [Nocardia sp. NBC_01503]WTL29847.1 helix-turn-helix domain-containing protein [Nocardia sp. NBC_01503]
MNTPNTLPGGFVARASTALLERIDDVVDRVAAEIERAEPVYGSLHAVTPEDLRRANRANLESILGHLAGRREAGIAAPRSTGHRRAETGVPLPAVLRAYRIGSGVVWDELLAMAGDDPVASRELLDIASHVWKLVDDYSQALTDGYQETVAEQLRRDARAHDAALDALLSGQVDGARLWEFARTLGIPAQGSYVVVASTTGTAASEALPGVDKGLSMLGVSSAWRVRADSHIGIIALTTRFTEPRLRALLAERSVGRVGISSTFGTLVDASAALRQAELACAATQPGSHQVLGYDDALIPVLVAGSPEVSSALARSILGPILALPEHDREVLLETMRTWFEEDGEVSAVAAALFCHRNTVRFRINRVAELTGRRLTEPRAATEIHLALEARRILGDPATAH